MAPIEYPTPAIICCDPIASRKALAVASTSPTRAKCNKSSPKIGEFINPLVIITPQLLPSPIRRFMKSTTYPSADSPLRPCNRRKNGLSKRNIPFGGNARSIITASSLFGIGTHLGNEKRNVFSGEIGDTCNEKRHVFHLRVSLISGTLFKRNGMPVLISPPSIQGVRFLPSYILYCLGHSRAIATLFAEGRYRSDSSATSVPPSSDNSEHESE
mmetsp:Transcript_14801/g.18647  ORF Transcript_14801/g.18647 Transcript_14801/m.18647 type:complete len:214 (+) Transcript_14801:706-1347(+)